MQANVASGSDAVRVNAGDASLVGPVGPEAIVVSGATLSTLNGQLVADWEDPKPETCIAGPIGLQHHSNKVGTAQEIRFRGLILSENPEERLLTVSAQ